MKFEYSKELLTSLTENLNDKMSPIDSALYGKQCHFFEGVSPDGFLQCYSRDTCENISLREVCDWYLNNLQEEDGEWFSAENIRTYIGDFFGYVAFLVATGHAIEPIN